MAEEEFKSFKELAHEARVLEKKAPRKVTVRLPEFELGEKNIVLLSPADITDLSYYDLLNEMDKVYKARAASYLAEGRAPPLKSRQVLKPRVKGASANEEEKK